MLFEVGEHRRWRDIRRGPCCCDSSRESREPAPLRTAAGPRPPWVPAPTGSPWPKSPTAAALTAPEGQGEVHGLSGAATK